MARPTLLLVAALTMASAALYTTRLGFAPVYLMHDESQFALQAASIASSGRDLAGRWFPVFFTEPEFPAGRDPAVIYLTAAGLMVMPVSEATVRLPVALLGVLNVVLMFLIGRRLFGNTWLALVAAVFMALTPAHFIRSRLLLSPQASIPIILAWLLCMAAFSAQPSTRRLGVAAAWLGLGLYTYLACVVMMPVYLVLTLIAGYRAIGPRAAVVAGVAFAVPLIPMAIWYVTHPERLAQIVGSYELARSVDSSVPALDTGLAALRTRLGLFWSFFSPEYLFLSGDPSLINSTRQTGLFPLSFAALIPLGVLQLARRRRGLDLIILAGLVSAPLAAVASGALEMNRVLYVLPFGVLAATYGVAWLTATQSWGWRVVAATLILAVPVQFAGFYGDYMGRYRVRSAEAFGGNTRDALVAAIVRSGAGSPQTVYVSRAIPYVGRYWRFYSLAEGRPDVIDRMALYGPELPAAVATGALLICGVAEPECARLGEGEAGWRQLEVAAEPTGAPSFALFERQ